MRSVVLLCALFLTAAAAQAQNLTAPPLVTAENEGWYRRGDPLIFSGDLYFRAGPAVFFNGNTMVRTGHYEGVPLYADTTIEPYSIVLVPIGGNLMQPYERVRDGELANTVGSRTPSFPVQSGSGARETLMAPIAPTNLAGIPSELIARATTGSGVALIDRAGPPQPAASTDVGPLPEPVEPRAEPDFASLARARSGVWLRFRGMEWASAGPAVPMQASEFVRVGEYGSFPVFERSGATDGRIYLPSQQDLLAPFAPRH